MSLILQIVPKTLNPNLVFYYITLQTNSITGPQTTWIFSFPIPFPSLCQLHMVHISWICIFLSFHYLRHYILREESPHIDLLHVKAYKKEYKPKPKPQPLISLQPNHRIEFKKMGSIDQEKQKPHAVFIPFPAQGHVSPMLKLAKLFHHKGFHITFVNTEYNHRRLLRSRGPNSLDGLPDFHFRTIPDGLPPSDGNATQHVPSLCYSTAHNCLAPFCNLISEINSSDDLPPVSCIISDGIMTFTFFAARQFEIPVAMFWTASACGYLGYMQYDKLVKEGLVPFKGIKSNYPRFPFNSSFLLPWNTFFPKVN